MSYTIPGLRAKAGATDDFNSTFNDTLALDTTYQPSSPSGVAISSGPAGDPGTAGGGIVPAGETVTLAGSQLVFVNTYLSGVTDAYRTAVVFAEQELESHFSNPVTITASFGFANLNGFLAENHFGNQVQASYAEVRSALIAHATTADDIAAVNSLPASDISGGNGFFVAGGLARLLGLPGSGQGASPDVQLVLGNGFTWNFDPNNRGAPGGDDAIGAIEHELTEGGFSRVAGLGDQNNNFGLLDLFRYSAPGVRDLTDGRDGKQAFFSVDGQQMLTPFHNSASSGTFDGEDPGDWDIGGDSFGFGGKGVVGVLSTTDLRLLDILGWTPTGSTPPPADDYANNVNDTTHPFGSVAVNGSSTGTLEVVADHDLFRVQLAAGTSYVITVLGQQGGGGSLEDPYLRVEDGAGNVLVQNDDIVAGVNRDSQLTFTPASSGTYYLDVGAYADQYTGTYKVSVSATIIDDFRNTLTDTSHPFGSVAVNGSSTGTLEIAGDRDWFQVQLIAGVTYVMSLLGADAHVGTLPDPYLRLHDSAGNILSQDDDIVLGINHDSQLTFTATSTGIFYLEAGAFADSYTGTYTVSVTAPDDFRNTLTDTSHPLGSVAVNGTATGTLEVAGDRDWFQVQLVAGTSYEINLQGADASSGTLPDPLLRLHDSTGALLTQSDDIVSGVIHDSQLTFTPTTTGTYYLEAGAFGDASAGTYRVSVIGNHAAVSDDFNGDGKSDIALRSDTGLAAIWNMNDGTTISSHSLGVVPSNWHVAGTGDFNDDGKTDFVWSNDAGVTAIWDMNDFGTILHANSIGTLPLNWTVAGIGDFNGDHKSDILWFNSAGTAAIWDMNDGTILHANSLGAIPSNWHIAGVGDFNGDGKSDILWKNDAGSLATWDMNDGAILHANSLGNLPSNWHIAGIGDFNGDHMSDILLRNDAGVAAIWDMNDGAILHANSLGPVPLNWHIADTGDYNGDGKSDILWHNDAGVTAIWEMNDATITNGPSLGTLPANWHLIV